MAARKGDWIQTYTGRQFWPLDPRPEDVGVMDIAHALSQLCRFTGHSTVFYSVAEHSYNVSLVVPRADALWGLLHDASEAYLCDLAAPVKRDPKMSGYQELENAVQIAICQRFKLPLLSVKEADLRMLATEAEKVMVEPPASWGLEKIAPYVGERFVPFGSRSPREMEDVFLHRYLELSGG